MPEISIIVPVFNVENYIEKSLLSIKEQSFTKFECVIVDDGSTDCSIDVAKKVIDGDDRFKIVKKKNGGPGDTRNFGLNFVKSEYICFLDSDDYYSRDFLDKMYHKATKFDLDVVICDTYIVDKDDSIIRRHFNKYSEIISGTEAFVDVTISKNILCLTQDKLFRRNLFANVKYPTDLYYEDRATIYKLFLNSKKVGFISEGLFFYVQRKGSITNSIKEKNIIDRKIVMDLIEKDFKDRNFISIYYREFLICYLLNYYLAGAAMIAKNGGGDKKWFKLLYENGHKDRFSFINILSVCKVSIKKMLALFLLKLDCRIFCMFHKKFYR